jgi:3-deoxy-manno-octulosonate cytidylyltransferase (CMP-KDO synthetase)
MNLPPTLIVIPARMQASRLPGKPLADIAGEAMIVHVWRRACAAALGPVVVAAAQEEIADIIRKAGGSAVLTAPDLPSGSDRVNAALHIWEQENGQAPDIVINLQGDLPDIAPQTIALVHKVLMARGGAENPFDIATLAAPIRDTHEADDPNVVKVIASFRDDYPKAGHVGRALYFTRARAPYGDGVLLHHIGIYGFWRDALERFVALEPSPLEKRERLEQLRALEAGMQIGVALVDRVPVGVDTPADLERARAIMEMKAAQERTRS